MLEKWSVRRRRRSPAEMLQKSMKQLYLELLCFDWLSHFRHDLEMKDEASSYSVKYNYSAILVLPRDQRLNSLSAAWISPSP